MSSWIHQAHLFSLPSDLHPLIFWLLNHEMMVQFYSLGIVQTTRLRYILMQSSTFQSQVYRFSQVGNQGGCGGGFYGLLPSFAASFWWSELVFGFVKHGGFLSLLMFSNVSDYCHHTVQYPPPTSILYHCNASCTKWSLLVPSLGPLHRGFLLFLRRALLLSWICPSSSQSFHSAKLMDQPCCSWLQRWVHHRLIEFLPPTRGGGLVLDRQIDQANCDYYLLSRSAACSGICK